MSESLTNRAPKWLLAVAIVVGLGVTVGIGIALVNVLPGRVGSRTFLPYEAGLFLGSLAGLGILCTKDRRARGWLLWTAVAGVVALTAVLAGYLGIDHNIVLGGQAVATGKGILIGIALAVWIVAYLVERFTRVHRPLFTALLVGLAIAGFTFENSYRLHGSVTGKYRQPWNTYHYYMGSKYFPELGYTDLYSAHLARDDQWIAERPERMKGKRDFSRVRKSRNMHTYKLESRKSLVEAYDNSAFTEARWDEFGRDLRAIRPWYKGKKWASVMMDLGYNPAPPWTIFGTSVANAIPVKSKWFWLITNSDGLGHLLAFIAMIWAFGLRRTAIAVLWVTAMPFNERYFIGAFARYDWLSMTLVALALYHKGWGRSAGVALSWAAMTRVFPGFLALPILVRAVWGLFRDGPKAMDKRRFGFAMAFGLSCSVLFGASHFTGRGAHTWLEWKENITLHSKLHPTTSSKRIGIPRLVFHEVKEHNFWSTVKGARFKLAEQRVGRKRVIQAIGLSLLLLALLRRRDLDAMLLMLFAVFLMVCTSRYYASIWMILFFLGARTRTDILRWPVFLAGLSLLVAQVVFFIPERNAGQYYLLNYEILAMFTALCLAFIGSLFVRWRAS